MTLTNSEIVTQVLLKLDGWVLSDSLVDDVVDDIDGSEENNVNDTINIDEPVDNSESITDLLTETNNDDNNTNDDDSIIDDLTYNKKITSTEIIQFYNDAIQYSQSYLQRQDTDIIPVYDTAVVFWTAGLIWEKYNQKENNQLDDTSPNPWGYGDKLIIQAKEMLKPYKGFIFTAF